MRTYTYNTEVYNFREQVKKALNVYNLERIRADYEVFSREKDQSSRFHQEWYSYVDSQDGKAFLQIYRDFVKDMICPLFPIDEILYQTKPTFRVHLPNNKAVGAFHCDSEYNHNPREINVFLPMTRAFESNTIWIESKVGLMDYTPMQSCYGAFTLFNGATLRHGNKINDTGVCRVSFDFRVLQRKFYEQGKKSVSQGRPFEIGPNAYWSEL